jgi:hypothetical protein
LTPPLRVCFLTHYFPPEVGAPQTRIELLARLLAERGLDVTVHTCFPHYPRGAVIAPYRNRPWHVEVRDGVRIVRSAVYPAPNRGFARRLVDHASFAVSALVTARLTGPLDAVVAETPPLFTAAAGAVYAAAKRAALVVNVADRWPASAVELGALRNRGAIGAASALERWIYGRADAITAPTDGIVSSLRLLPSSAGKSARLWPVVDLDRFVVDHGSRGDPGGPLRLLYAGTVGLAQGLETLVEASRLAGPEIVRTTIAGSGAEVESVRSLVRELRLTNVELLAPVPAGAVPALYAAADAGVVLLRDLPIFEGALPTKLFEVMAASKPVVLAASGESARLVADAGAGIVVAPGDPVALADACRRLHAEPGLRRSLGVAGRRFVERRLGAGRAADAWATVIEGASAGRSSRG